jgi:hypothetical protein
MAAGPDQEALNRRLILTPPGEDWSGRTRYGAAMYFYSRGDMSAEVLEVYRICCRQDHEDPTDVMRYLGLGEDWIQKLSAFRNTI